jgi:peptidoglycan/xylan/chitin deacetylase (PgdA/CDA1 family)
VLVTLTFDNGPHPEATPQVLDVLADRDAKATFFVVGEQLMTDGGRGLAERAHGEGHWIGNHTMTHSTPLGVDTTAAFAEAEIERTQEVIGDLAHHDRFFRPFGEGGHITTKLLSRAAVDLLERDGYTCVLWNSVPRDWEHPFAWVETAFHDAARLAHTVVALHDLPTGAMAHLDRFIDGIRERGGHFVQEFPDEVLPIKWGHPGDLRGIVAA